uniref:Uncharacterized protein n=1 Tax=Hemiselmis andersenii TaxID=464988 RepID=A0A6U2FSV7_HEMAN|mmetsp:Transcript_33341/g.78107  ORF Transcript_33341/g.78107 Transcript_33341/m.78107 type:complete len:398 (-) Transcript_33341:48-1241(-)|eukprot:CAMPEP_0114141058 /NCGR_PEP_ID=MMETSP0043_2-20121206/17713_1 /TAXON_ID=464988 /ORGANISM="Hemiselmis andersenii, Strain CCMP644" /LENGTH=397 /DNA_ID=CAMNT_0001235189 /DNA_START=173 /DNA_END=1366 /DNA_ORIENTATION=-
MCPFKVEEVEGSHSAHHMASAAMHHDSPQLSSIDSKESSPPQRPLVPTRSQSPTRTPPVANSPAPHPYPPIAPKARNTAGKGGSALEEGLAARGNSHAMEVTGTQNGESGAIDAKGKGGSHRAPSAGARHEDSSPASAAESCERSSPMPHLSLTATSKVQCHVGEEVRETLPAGQPAGCSRVGGQDWVRRRKNETQKLAFRTGMSPHELQVANVCKAVERLQALLPNDAKARFLAEMRRYADQAVSPEDFAETIKGLVDEFGVVVPLNDMPVGGWHRPERDLEGSAGSGGGRGKAPRPSKRGSSAVSQGTAFVSKRPKGSHGDGSPPSATAPGKAGAVVGKKGVAAPRKGMASAGKPPAGKHGVVALGRAAPPQHGAVEEDNSAWEALLSVCSDICA